MSDDVFGTDWQQLEFTDAQATLAYLNSNNGTDWNIGDVVYAEIEFEMDDDISDEQQFTLSLQADSTSDSGSISDNLIESTYKSNFFSIGSGVFRTPNLSIPADTYRLQHRTKFEGSGTIRFRSAAIKIVE